MAFPQDIHVTNGIPDIGTGTVKTIDGLIATGIPITGTVGVTQSGAWAVTISAGAAVVGAVTQSGTWNIGTLATITNPVAATQSGAWNMGQTGTWTVQPGNTANTTAWLVTGTGGTFPATQSGTWSVRNLGNAGGILDFASTQNVSAPNSAFLTGGQFNTSPTTITSGNVSPLQLDANGNLKVNVNAGGGSGGTNSNFGATFPAAGTAIGAKSGANMVNLLASAAGSLIILPGDGTNTAAVKAASTAAVAGDAALVVALSPNGEVADGSTDGGTGNKIAAKTHAGVAGDTMLSTGQRADLACGNDRILLTRTTPLDDIVSGTPATLSGTTAAAVIPAAGSGVKNYLTSVTISNSTAGFVEVNILNGTGGSVMWTFPVPASSGITHNFQVPLGGFTGNTAIAAVGVTSATGVKVSMNGFKSKI